MPRKRPRLIPLRYSNENTFEDKQKIYTALIIYFSTGINITLLLLVGFQTVIPTTLLISLFFILTFAGFVYCKRKNVSRPVVKAYGIIPTILNLILVVNYCVSFNPCKETYRFYRNSEEVTGISMYNTRRQMTSIITLENEAYKYSYGIRIFKSYEDISGTERITFIFKTGLLGIKVLTDYDFH